MDLKITGKTALVTASTAGIGFAIAQTLYREGANVIVNGRSSDRVNEAVEKIMQMVPQRTSRVQGLPADLTSREGIGAIQKQFPQVDILINNLGHFEAKPMTEIREED